MNNAAPLEVFWTFIATVGWVISLLVLGGAGALLYRRYQEARNGAVRLLAWQFAIDTLCVTLGLTAALAIGGVALVLPPRTEQIEGWLEQQAAILAGWLTPLALLIIVLCLFGIAINKFIIGLLLRRHYQALERRHWTPDNHPGRRRDDQPTPIRSKAAATEPKDGRPE